MITPRPETVAGKEFCRREWLIDRPNDFITEKNLVYTRPARKITIMIIT